MGNATGLVTFYIGYSVFALMIILGVMAVDPSSNMLASNSLYNAILPEVSNIGSANNPNYQFNNSLGSQIPSRGTTGSSGISGVINVIFPDWLASSFLWVVNAGKFVINMIGAPYTILQSFFGANNFTTILGVGFSMLNIFVFVNWIRGTDN